MTAWNVSRGSRLAGATPNSENAPEKANSYCQDTVAVGLGAATHCHATATQDRSVNIGPATNLHGPVIPAANCVALKSHSSGSSRLPAMNHESSAPFDALVRELPFGMSQEDWQHAVTAGWLPPERHGWDSWPRGRLSRCVRQTAVLAMAE
jgi:hypothetical protein